MGNLYRDLLQTQSAGRQYETDLPGHTVLNRVKTEQKSFPNVLPVLKKRMVYTYIHEPGKCSGMWTWLDNWMNAMTVTVQYRVVKNHSLLTVGVSRAFPIRKNEKKEGKKEKSAIEERCTVDIVRTPRNWSTSSQLAVRPKEPPPHPLHPPPVYILARRGAIVRRSFLFSSVSSTMGRMPRSRSWARWALPNS